MKPVNSRVEGLTLIELVIVLAIVAIMTTMGAPSFSNQVSSADIRSVSEEVLSAYRVARMESLRQNKVVELNFTVSDGQVNGVEVTADSGDTILRRWSLSGSEVSIEAMTATSEAVGKIGYEEMGFIGTLFKEDDTSVIADQYEIEVLFCSSNVTGETGRKLTLHQSGMAELSEHHACS